MHVGRAQSFTRRAPRDACRARTSNHSCIEGGGGAARGRGVACSAHLAHLLRIVHGLAILARAEGGHGADHLFNGNCARLVHVHERKLLLQVLDVLGIKRLGHLHEDSLLDVVVTREALHVLHDLDVQRRARRHAILADPRVAQRLCRAESRLHRTASTSHARESSHVLRAEPCDGCRYQVVEKINKDAEVSVTAAVQAIKHI